MNRQAPLLRWWRDVTGERRRRRAAFVETAFLPAALEATESPPSPIGRAILWVILCAAAAAIGWAFIGQVDTVAVAEGRLAPSGRLRSVEAFEPGVVREIAVREGQRVRKGQVLIALDATAADADAGSARIELSTAGLVRSRATALLAAAEGRVASFTPPPGADPRAIEAEQQLIAARVREHRARQGGLAERRAAALATVRLAEAGIDKLQQTIPLADEQMAAQEALAAKGYASRFRLLQEKERAVALRQDLRAERARREEALAQVAAIDRELTQGQATFRGQAAQERAEAEAVVATRGEAVRKASQRADRQTLAAPVSGIVQEVSVTTLGEVAEAGQSLVKLVPDGERLVVEALLLNRDAGVVRAGAKVAVKIEAYPFTRYGTVPGVLEFVSPDAIVDERRGLVFPARIRLADPAALAGRGITLSPGMTASVEIVTGHRRVIDYLWSPVAKTVSEAGRER